MKKFLKLLALPLLAMFLVACNETPEETAPETTPTEETTPVEESATDATSETTEESTDAEGSTESAADTESETAEDADTAEADETAVTISLIISADEETVGEFTVPNAEGMSVMEAMEAAEELNFTFNEEEGIIDVIADIENDYDAGNTWVYLLNDQMAELGVVSQTLEAGDNIKWYFGSIDEIPITIIPATEEEALDEEAVDAETEDEVTEDEQVVIEEDGE